MGRSSSHQVVGLSTFNKGCILSTGSRRGFLLFRFSIADCASAIAHLSIGWGNVFWTRSCPNIKHALRLTAVIKEKFKENKTANYFPCSIDNYPPPQCLQHIFLTVLSSLPNLASLFSIIPNNLPSLSMKNSFKPPKTTPALQSFQHKSSKKPQLRYKQHQEVLNSLQSKWKKNKSVLFLFHKCSECNLSCLRSSLWQKWTKKKQVHDLLTRRRAVIDKKGWL